MPQPYPLQNHVSKGLTPLSLWGILTVRPADAGIVYLRDFHAMPHVRADGRLRAYVECRQRSTENPNPRFHVTVQ